MIRTYSELILLPTFEERFNYLKLNGTVGNDTFGWKRWMNQEFYKHSVEWKEARYDVIIRDYGRDLGLEGYDICGNIYVHHMNPIEIEDIDDISYLTNPEYLICTSFKTHQAIHYGNIDLLDCGIIERKPNDTKLW